METLSDILKMFELSQIGSQSCYQCQIIKAKAFEGQESMRMCVISLMIVKGIDS